MSKLVLFNKPYGVICQFSEHEKHVNLSEFIKIKNVYAAGRLDHDSEGLLVLTDDGALQHKIASPQNKMLKTYWVQVDREITEQALAQLRKGVELKDGLTKPAQAKKIDEPGMLWVREPAVRFRKNVATSWIELSIREGKNRQVRRMTAAVGFPTLRLIRYRIGDWTIDDIASGQYVCRDSQ